MSWRHIVNFNENSLTNVRDYSNNLFHSSSVTNLTIENGTIGKRGVFDGTTVINFGNISYTAATSIMFQFRIIIDDSSALGYIARKNGVFAIYVDTDSRIKCSITTGAGTVTAQTSVLSISTEYDIIFRYDGSNIRAYRNVSGVATLEDTQAQTGALITNSNSMSIGANVDSGTDYLVARLEEFRVKTGSLTDNNIQGLFDNPTGIEIGHDLNRTDIEVGDIFIAEPSAQEADRVRLVLTHVDTTNFLAYIIPIGTVAPPENISWNKVGHRWDTDRQDLLFIGLNNALNEIRGVQDVNTFTDIQDETNMIFALNKNGVRYRVIAQVASSPTTIGNSDHYVPVSTAAARTINLPSSPSRGQRHTIYDDTGDASTNPITVSGNGSTINGLNSDLIATDKGSRTYIYDGGEWITIARFEARPGMMRGCRLAYASASTVTIGTSNQISWLTDSASESEMRFTGTLTADITASGANGLDTGSEAANTWYAVHVIWGNSGVASLLSTSATAPSMPSGYTYFRRVGWVRNNGSSNFLLFLQTGSGVDRWIYYDLQVSDKRALTAGNATVQTSVSLATFVPTTSRWAQLHISFDPNTGPNTLTLWMGGSTAANNKIFGIGGSSGINRWPTEIIALSSTQTVDYKVTQASDAVWIEVNGYMDEL